MNLLWLVLQEHGAPGAETPNVFQLTSNVMFWTLVIFAVLFAVLLKFAFPPILGYANAREQRIQETLDESRRQREEAERLLEQQRQELSMARAEAQQIIAEGKQAAEKVRQDVLNRARVEHEELLNRAKADIETERTRAIESVRRDAVDLALAAAAKLVEQKLDTENDRKLVTDFLARAQTSGARA